MKIEIKLFATLKKHLPPNADGSSATVEVQDGLTVSGLIEHLKIPKELAQLVLVNGVNIEGDYTRKLEEGDTVSIFPPVAGGSSGAIRKNRGALRMGRAGPVIGQPIRPWRINAHFIRKRAVGREILLRPDGHQADATRQAPKVEGSAIFGIDSNRREG